MFRYHTRLDDLRYAHTPSNIRKHDSSRVTQFVGMGTCRNAPISAQISTIFKFKNGIVALV